MSEILWSEPDDGTFQPKGEVLTAEMLLAMEVRLRALIPLPYGRQPQLGVGDAILVEAGYISLQDIANRYRLNAILASSFWSVGLHGGFWPR